MSNVNVQNLFSLLILASVVHEIRSQWDYFTEKREIASRPCHESNSDESQNKTNITSITAITVDYEKFNDYELKKLFVKKFKLYKDSVSKKLYNESLEIIGPQRKPRAVPLHATVRCRSCYAAGTSKLDEKCYNGAKVPTTKCADAEYCFTEIHPEYLRRGCVLPGRVNRTFVCKCPLCNDKPSTEFWHYEYTSINDWAYDNSRLSKRLLGMDLICKVCETKGVDPVQDQSCRSGKNAEYMVCPHNHICYTNIDDEIDFVSRGCINRPVYNSIFYFCNSSSCNDNAYLRPKLRIQKEEITVMLPQTNLKSVSILGDNKSSLKEPTGFLLIVSMLGIKYVSELCVVHGESKENTNSKKFIPYFRRQVEEMEDNILSETTEKDDPRGNLVSFLVQNVKEIFDDIVENTEARTPEISLKPTMTTVANVTPSPTNSLASVTTTVTISSTEVSIVNTTSTTSTPVTSMSPNRTTTVSTTSTTTTPMPTTPTEVINENLTLTTLLDEKRTRKSELTKKKSVSKTDKMDYDSQVQHASSSLHIDGNSTDQFMEHDPRRSCISCNNVGVEDCNDPKNKLIQSVMCEHDDDLCYSMHTPFGIIDRGCYNSNHNLTTYVCSCNLCNYISISEMPYTFNTKQDWIDNVIEISRTRHFRKSIFKDMSCLRCEVNSTVQKADLIESANCLEGSIGNIPVEECEQNEVCAVKAHRADGYIWRGCVRTPLYNYWWQFCDYDLCNYDTVLSLYDFI